MNQQVGDISIEITARCGNRDNSKTCHRWCVLDSQNIEDSIKEAITRRWTLTEEQGWICPSCGNKEI